MTKQTSLSHPKYWHIWLGIAFLRFLAFLPFKAGLIVGRGIGICLYYLIPKRRTVTEVNARLCFPNLSTPELKQFVKDVFINNGIGIIETAWSYWGNRTKIKQNTTYIGFELLETALKRGNGAIVLGAHYSTLDLGVALLSMYGKPTIAMYRKHNNPVMEKVISSGRANWGTPVERKQLRKIVRHLKNNEIIWYGPDQDFGTKNTVFVPFFGQNAATTTATTKIVKLNNSPILSLHQHRNKDNSGYTIRIAEVPGFPSGDDREDASIINLAIEEGIRKDPAQYMWMHKRFKTRPDGSKNFYQQFGC